MSAPVIGIGFRAQASIAELEEALRHALAMALLHGRDGPACLATPKDKAAAPAFTAAASRLGLTILPITETALQAAARRCLSHSAMVEAKRGVGSVAEAAALAGAGDDAQLLGPRTVSPCRRVTTAIAVTAHRDGHAMRHPP